MRVASEILARINSCSAFAGFLFVMAALPVVFPPGIPTTLRDAAILRGMTALSYFAVGSLVVYSLVVFGLCVVVFAGQVSGSSRQRVASTEITNNGTQ